jgi:hypothetical protein
MLADEKPPPIALLEQYKAARAYIEHENGLVAARIGWFLTAQGFLFAGFFIVVQIPWRKPGDFSVDGLLCVACLGAIGITLMGITTALLVQKLLAMAIDELRRIRAWWQVLKPTDDSLPDLGSEVPSLTADKFAWVFVVVWAVLLVAFFVGVSREGLPLSELLVWFWTGLPSRS